MNGSSRSGGECRVQRRWDRLALAEPLEDRRVLDVEGPLFPELPAWTISFAPDGADIAGEANVMHDKFAEYGDGWRHTILAAFQAWARETNGDIGVVADSGDPFGTPGPRIRDARFGDIRVGARPLAENVMAISIPQSAIVSGTWAGDIIFNSNADFPSLAVLHAVALHEAGHVYGLFDTPATRSRDFRDTSTDTLLTEEDIAALQALHGVRRSDYWESDEGFEDNDTLRQASELEAEDAIDDIDGTAPAIIFADLTSPDDIDYFEVDAEGYRGPITVRLTVDGISMLQAAISLRDQHDNVLALGTVSPDVPDELQLKFDNRDYLGDLYVRVESANDGLFSVGGYSLVAIFDELNVIDDATIDQIVHIQHRRLLPADFDDFFDDDEFYFIGQDFHTDDDLDSAEELVPLDGSPISIRYEFVGSLTDQTDVDSFVLTVPAEATLNADTLTLTIRTLNSMSFVPAVKLFDSQRRLLETYPLIHGNGEVVLQARHVAGEAKLYVELSSSGGTPMSLGGNYALHALLGGPATTHAVFSSGKVGNETQAQPLHVATPQLFQLGLQVGSVDDATSLAVSAAIVDGSGRNVFQTIVHPGQFRSAPGVLLNPGTYWLLVNRLSSTIAGQDSPPLGFELVGSIVSDPFGVDPLVPSAIEFQCEDAPGLYCYPSGVVSSSPFLWDEFLGAMDDQGLWTGGILFPQLEDSWATWYRQQSQSNMSPAATGESYYVPADSYLEVSLPRGVLANDLDSDGDTMTAVLVSSPSHGQLVLDPSGEFLYEPNLGFVGRDSFSYRAADDVAVSEIVVVTLQVGHTDPVLGDFDHDGLVTVADLNQLHAALQVGDNAYDLDGNGTLDTADWRRMVLDVMGGVAGDVNWDGVFDSRDLVLVFQAGHYDDAVPKNSSWSRGDWNGDGDFTSADLVFAFQTSIYQRRAGIAGK